MPWPQSSFLLRWREGYEFVGADAWQREPVHELRVLDLLDAQILMRRVAREDRSFLMRLGCALLPWQSAERDCSNDELQGLLRRLETKLGCALSAPGKPPQFAALYVCRRKTADLAGDPVRQSRSPRLAIEAARRSPRGYVAVEVVGEEGRPAVGVRLSLVTSDGELHSVVTDDRGLARAEPVSTGRCHIRLPDLDGSAWRPADGAASAPVDRGYPRTHVVQRGDSVARVARRSGFGSWKQLWNAPANASLRRRRKSPHLLLPGDELFLPALQVHEIARPTDATHRIIVRRGDSKIRVRLQDQAKRPFADLAYDLRFRVGGAWVERAGAAPTDGGGWLEELLPLDVVELEVTLRKSQLVFELEVNTLAPLREDDTRAPVVAGIAMRLAALGYAPDTDELANAALAQFQADELGRRDAQGELDDETLDALERAYGA